MRTFIFTILILVCSLNNAFGADNLLSKAKKAANICKKIPLNSVRAIRDVICFNGSVTKIGGRTIDLLNSDLMDRNRYKIIVIDGGGGGTVSTAIPLARKIEALQLLDVFRGACWSSCANYIFTTETQKVVLKDSFIAWHGAPQKSTIKRYEKLYPKNKFGKRLIKGQVEDSIRFYSIRNIPYSLPRNAPYYSERRNKKYFQEKGYQSKFWSWPKGILERIFNVKGIEYYWMPKNKRKFYEKVTKKHGVHLIYGDWDDFQKDQSFWRQWVRDNNKLHLLR